MIKKAILILLIIVISLLLPTLIQKPLNFAFRDFFNPTGWKILIPSLRVTSTLVCFAITYLLGFLLLRKAESKKWLFILHFICTFLWCLFIAAKCHFAAAPPPDW